MKRETLRNLALLAMSVALSVGAAEAALRGLAPAPRAFRVWPADLDVTFRPAAGVMPGVTGPSRFRTNSQGIRGDEPGEEDRYRILALGGSTTESLYLDDEEAWPRLIQADVERRLGEEALWVGNVGKSALNTRHHVLQFLRYLPQHPEIDAVILMIGINDLHQRLARDEEFRPLPEESDEVFWKLYRSAFSVLPEVDTDSSIFLPGEVLFRIRRLRGTEVSEPVAPGTVQDEAGQAYLKWRNHRRDAPIRRRALPDLGSALDEYARNLNTIADLAHGLGIRLILATQPTLWSPGLSPELRNLLWMGGVGRFQREAGHEYYSAEALASAMAIYNRVLLGVCAARQLECLDLASQLPPDTSVFYDDCHFNESGARRAASIFADHLMDLPPFATAAASD